jgi:CBS-domain-containing membrane protein
MNIQTVATNLRVTITGKEEYLEKVRKARKFADEVYDQVLYTRQEFLKINIDELKRILQDVEQCIGVE